MPGLLKPIKKPGGHPGLIYIIILYGLHCCSFAQHRIEQGIVPNQVEEPFLVEHRGG